MCNILFLSLSLLVSSLDSSLSAAAYILSKQIDSEMASMMMLLKRWETKKGFVRTQLSSLFRNAQHVVLHFINLNWGESSFGIIMWLYDIFH